MIIRHAMAFNAALALFSTPALAGPCTQQIYDAELALDQRLNSAAARGHAGTQSTGAMLHHQPTPNSLAQAEEKAGDLSEADVAAGTADMDEARKADDAGDLAACQKALADLRRILGR
jgi:hypothetical protein